MNWLKVFHLLLSLFRKLGNILHKKIISSSSGLRLLSFFLFSCFFSLSFLIEINATSTYFNNNELWFNGTLKYINSDSGTPVDSLNGEFHIAFCNAEAERSLAIDPSITNLSSSVVSGYLDNGMYFEIPYTGRIEVTQLHRIEQYNGYVERNSTAYYDIEIDDIQTNLLYRPDRNDWYIKTALSACVIFSIICIFRMVRR